MNFFDVLIVIALVAGAAWGFIKGIIHQAIGVGLIYVSIIVATIFYSVVAPGLGRLIKVSSQAAGALSFLLLMIITLNVLALALRDVRKREIKLLRLINQLGGMTFGFVIASVWIALVIALLHYAVGGPVSWHDPGKPVLLSLRSETIRLAIVDGLAGSPLVRAFSELLPWILTSVSPFAPTKDILNIFII